MGFYGEQLSASGIVSNHCCRGNAEGSHGKSVANLKRPLHEEIGLSENRLTSIHWILDSYHFPSLRGYNPTSKARFFTPTRLVPLDIALGYRPGSRRCPEIAMFFSCHGTMMFAKGMNV